MVHCIISLLLWNSSDVPGCAWSLTNPGLRSYVEETAISVMNSNASSQYPMVSAIWYRCFLIPS